MVQVRHLTTMHDELAVNYCQLAVVSTDPIPVTAAFRAGLGATFTFLSEHARREGVRGDRLGLRALDPDVLEPEMEAQEDRSRVEGPLGDEVALGDVRHGVILGHHAGGGGVYS